MALGQLSFSMDGTVRDKVETAIFRLRQFEPEEGYYVAFSGGKDSQCVYHLCKMAGVKFDAHYSVTSVDPPELVRFIRENYPDVKMERQHYPDGRPVTMWTLIPEKRMPPTRTVRYCCEKLKESSGKWRRTVTGVRWAESPGRKLNQGTVVVPTKGKKFRLRLVNNGVNFTKTKRGGGTELRRQCGQGIDHDLSADGQGAGESYRGLDGRGRMGVPGRQRDTALLSV